LEDLLERTKKNEDPHVPNKNGSAAETLAQASTLVVDVPGEEAVTLSQGHSFFQPGHRHDP